MLVTTTDRTFVGGMSLEIPFAGARRLNGTIGTAQLRISEGKLGFGTWIKMIPKNLRSVDYRREDVAEVFSTKSLVPMLQAYGKGVATTDRKTHYFST